jgi:hypothetical protein
MRKSALVLLSVFLVTPAFADDTIATATTAEPTVGQSDIARVVPTALKPDGSAGKPTEVAAPMIGSPAPLIERPVASPRMLRRMAVDRTLRTIDAGLHACAASMPAKSGASLLVRLSVTWAGEVDRAEVTGEVLPEAVSACLQKVGRSAKFAPPGSLGATVLVPVVLAAPAPKEAPSLPVATAAVANK